MVAQPVEDFLDDAFVAAAAQTLRDVGFVADEHEFAPYRETVSERVEAIEEALRDAGHEFDLVPGYTGHPHAGFSYFIYDSDRFEGHAEAAAAVRDWLDGRYLGQ